MKYWHTAHRIQTSLLNNRKIEAVKIIRGRTGCTLRRAVYVINRIDRPFRSSLSRAAVNLLLHQSCLPKYQTSKRQHKEL
jgi:hypothetical protein